MNNPQSAGPNPQSVELHIEELALDGFAPGNRYRIAEAVERELARLLAEEGVTRSLSQSGAGAELNAGAFQMTPDATAQETGAKIAQAVYGGISR